MNSLNIVNNDNNISFINYIKFDEKKHLNFKRNDSLIIFSLLIGIPVFLNIILTILNIYIVDKKIMYYLIISENILYYLSILFGSLYVYLKDKNYFFSKVYWFYIVYALVYPNIFIISSNLWNLFFSNDTYYSNSFHEGTILFFNFILLVIFLVCLYKNNNLCTTMFYNFRNWKSFLISLLILIFSFSIIFLLNFGLDIFSKLISSKNNSINQEIIKTNLNKNVNIIISKINLVFTTIIVAPIFEELLYRKILINVGNNSWYTIFLSSFFFGFLHIRSFFDWSWIFPYLSLAIVNAFLYWKFSNLSILILNHMIMNVIGVIFLLK